MFTYPAWPRFAAWMEREGNAFNILCRIAIKTTKRIGVIGMSFSKLITPVTFFHNVGAWGTSQVVLFPE